MWSAYVCCPKFSVESYIEAELDLDEMDLTAAERKATYKEIKGYVLEGQL